MSCFPLTYLLLTFAFSLNGALLQYFGDMLLDFLSLPYDGCIAMLVQSALDLSQFIWDSGELAD